MIMKATEFRAMSADELKTELMALLKEQFNLRMQKGGGQAVKPHLLKQARRNIARIKTILTEKSRSEK